MKEFKFSYYEENDDLFIYLDGKRSAGAIEIGDFVFDFDEDKNLVAIQILNASEVLSKLVSKIVSLSNIREINAKVINFRNMDAIDIEVDFGEGIERVPIIVPRVRDESPVLGFQ